MRRSCMRREELYLADSIDNVRAVRGYRGGVTRERWDADAPARRSPRWPVSAA
jgi:hypothetical protein